MPKRNGKHYTLVKGSEPAMQAFKMEIAKELGLADKIGKDGSFKNFTTEEVGLIGGTMVRKIQAAGELAIMQRFNNGEDTLMPSNVLPHVNNMRDPLMKENTMA